MKKSKVVVLKFGGTSLGNVERLKNAAEIITSYKRKRYQPVVVVSAMGDTTDRLLSLANKITSSPTEREVDMLVSTGEQVSSSLLTMALHRIGENAVSFTGHQVGILTDSFHTRAKIVNIETRRIKQALKQGKIVVIAGFQGITPNNDISTLGRGGSDLSAVALAYTLGACACYIYTDVEGIYTADPRIVPAASKIGQISFDEMLEMASLGAQVMQTRAVEFAKKYNIPLVVKSSLSKGEGTVIMDTKRTLEGPVVRGITLNEESAKITVCDVPDKPGVAAGIFKELAEASVNVDMIVQNVSHKRITDISFTVDKSVLSKAVEAAERLAKKIGAADILSDQDIAKVSVVGIGMKSHPGVAAKVFKALSGRKVNIEMITTSEISISCVIAKKYGKIAVRALHKEFGL